jgi:hypothetical protein
VAKVTDGFWVVEVDGGTGVPSGLKDQLQLVGPPVERSEKVTAVPG